MGVFRPALATVDELRTGEVGFMAASIKNVKDCRVGDTVTEAARPSPVAPARLPQSDPNGLLRPLPVDSVDYEDLRDALEAQTKRRVFSL